jgi:glycosyl transferase family 25
MRVATNSEREHAVSTSPAHSEKTRQTHLPAIPVYVINLESATKRWANVQKIFSAAGINFSRVPAIDGKTLEWGPTHYSEGWYRSLHGRETNPPEIACYLSHLEALRVFLETEAELAFICEDDLEFGADLATLLVKALALPRFWNVLRLSGLSAGRPLKVRKFYGDHWLCINSARIKGSGAYLVDRTAARTFLERLLPMMVPYDHALDREWFYGLTAACVSPFPIVQRQKRFGSAIQTYAQSKLPPFRRWLTTYPYQAGNEIARWIFRGALFLWVKLGRRAA